ncbi:hypothetical protein, partial [Pseudomonas aeruginosa]|uniref:hypothetical protein n=1 Tax=Pseudomonas aeruginosa TaxID=287 RepID=UPI00300700CF
RKPSVQRKAGSVADDQEPWRNQVVLHTGTTFSYKMTAVFQQLATSKEWRNNRVRQEVVVQLRA